MATDPKLVFHFQELLYRELVLIKSRTGSLKILDSLPPWNATYFKKLLHAYYREFVPNQDSICKRITQLESKITGRSISRLITVFEADPEFQEPRLKELKESRQKQPNMIQLRERPIAHQVAELRELSREIQRDNPELKMLWQRYRDECNPEVLRGLLQFCKENKEFHLFTEPNLMDAFIKKAFEMRFGW
ncbi:hypothetical protein EDC01DRAFT_626064 [Geopyxis carbonaria]|nr:hypothetical protein EDC01DRAFT_626064 [Geopyxis carbonaria]